jgi:hypothetical protein
MDLDELRLRDLGITFHVDTGFLGTVGQRPSRAACYLREMARANRIRLRIASVGPRELEGSANPEVRDLATDMTIALEAGVWGESSWKSAVFASDADADELEAIHQILAPGGTESARARTLRDAIHLQTAVRYAADGFVTTDVRHILNRTEALRPLIPVYSIEQAALIVRRRRRGQRITVRQREEED